MVAEVPIYGRGRGGADEGERIDETMAWGERILSSPQMLSIIGVKNLVIPMLFNQKTYKLLVVILFVWMTLNIGYMTGNLGRLTNQETFWRNARRLARKTAQVQASQCSHCQSHHKQNEQNEVTEFPTITTPSWLVEEEEEVKSSYMTNNNSKLEFGAKRHTAPSSWLVQEEEEEDGETSDIVNNTSIPLTATETHNQEGGTQDDPIPPLPQQDDSDIVARKSWRGGELAGQFLDQESEEERHTH